MSIWRSEKSFSGKGKRIALVAAQFNQDQVLELQKNVLSELLVSEVSEDDVETVWVPGSFEIPFTCQKILKTKKYDAIITLGIIIRGETFHFELIAEQTARGIMTLNLNSEIPIIFGVLACDTEKQAQERLSLGKDFAKAALQMVN